MKEFKKNKKRYNLLVILVSILSVVALVAGISLDFLSEMDNIAAMVCFVIAFMLVALCIIFLIFMLKYQSKLSKKIVEELNQTLEGEYFYQEGNPILDIVEDSMHPYDKGTNVFSEDGIIGKYEGIDFEYYLCKFQGESLFSRDSKNIYELYVFKNISVFPKEFFVTAKKLKNVEQYKVIPTIGEASIYTMKNEEICLDDLPKDVVFLSRNGQTLYVYKIANYKKALFQEAKDMEDFKKLFENQIEKIKDTYEESKAWM